MPDEANKPEPPRAKGCIMLLALGGMVLLAGALFPPLQFVGCAVTPSRLIGQVLDQDGNPVPEAQVRVSRHIVPFDKGSETLSFTDDEGKFSYFGVQGLFLTVFVSKDGYYKIYEPLPNRSLNASSRSFGSTEGGFPNPRHREVFHLFRPPPPESLIQHQSRDYPIARDGSPVVVRLNLSDTGPPKEIELRCWTSVSKGQEGARYDWRAEIRPRNGALVRRKDNFDLIAPTEGYEPVIEIKMPSRVDNNVNARWSSDVEVDAFYRFEDDLHARAKVRFIAGGEHFVVFESLLNPKAGSKNLSLLPKP